LAPFKSSLQFAKWFREIRAAKFPKQQQTVNYFFEIIEGCL